MHPDFLSSFTVQHQIAGNLAVLNPCVMLTIIDLSKCNVHGEISTLEK